MINETNESEYTDSTIYSCTDCRKHTPFKMEDALIWVRVISCFSPSIWFCLCIGWWRSVRGQAVTHKDSDLPLPSQVIYRMYPCTQKYISHRIILYILLTTIFPKNQSTTYETLIVLYTCVVVQECYNLGFLPDSVIPCMYQNTHTHCTT